MFSSYFLRAFSKWGIIFYLFFYTFLITSSKEIPPIDSKNKVSVISARTPYVCITISSYNVFDLFASIRYYSPQHWPLLATIVPFFSFFKLPSMITTIFWKPATPFLKIDSLALKDDIFMAYMTFSVWVLFSLQSSGFFSNAHLIKFLKVTS